DALPIYHGADVPGLRLEGEKGTFGPVRRRGVLGGGGGGAACLERAEALAESRLGFELQAGSERGVHVESALEDEVGAVLCLEVLLHVLEVVLAGRAPPLGRH